MHLHTKILTIVSLALLIIANPVYAKNEKLFVNINNAEYPYFTFTKEHLPKGFIYDLLNTLDIPNKELAFVRDSVNINSENLIYGYSVKGEEPHGCEFVELPHRIVYYVFTRKGANIISLNDLLNKKIIVLKNDLPYSVLYENKASHILKVKSYKEALTMLSSGINDCAIIPFQVGVTLIENEELKNIDYVITPFLSFDFGLAIPSEQQELIKHVKTSLRKILQNNKYKLLEDQWFISFSDARAKLSKRDKVLFVTVGLLLIIVVLLVGFIRFLLNEMSASTQDYINELSQSNLAPLSLNMDDPIVSKIFSDAPAWLYVNDINNKIHHISKDLLLEFLQVEKAPDDLKVSDLFGETLATHFNSFDQRIQNQGDNLKIEKVQFQTQGQTSNRWLIKYPVRFQGKNQLMFANLIIKPVISDDYSLRILSPEFVLRSVIDSLPDLVFIKNDKGVYLGGNKAFFDFCGKPEDEIVGKTDFEIFDNDKAENYSKSDKLVFKEGVIWENQEWDTINNGDALLFENTKIPLSNKKNEIFALVGLSHNVTNHHKYEQELASAKEKAEESDRIKSSFLANMSHEIRTPMNSIIGFSDLLADPDLTIDQRIEIIDLIQSNGHTLIDLIDDIIDFSRIESGQIHLKFNDFNLNNVVKDAYNYAISKRNQLSKEHMNITFDVGSMEDTFRINSDPFRLRQVLKNLLNSSIRFSTSESVYIGYLVEKENIILYIKNDNNIISDEITSKLLAREVESKISFSDIEESAGIALIIAKNVIEMINGYLYIEEVKPGRTDFYFAIPLKRAEVIEPVKVKPSITDIPDWTGKVILIAEDEETNFLLLDGVLSKTNAEIIRAVNGKEAVDLYKEHATKVNLVLMDIRMPEMNGAEASRKIIEFDPEVKIIAQTAYAMPEDKDQYLKVGMKAVLAKPIDPSEMYYVCSKYL